MKSNNIDFTFNTAVKADKTKKCAICWICVTQHKHQIICHVNDKLIKTTNYITS